MFFNQKFNLMIFLATIAWRVTQFLDFYRYVAVECLYACWTQFATFYFQQPFYFLFDCASKFSNRLSFYLISIARPRRLQMGRKMFQNVVWNCYLIRIAPSSISNYLGTIYIYASPTTNKTTNQGYRKKRIFACCSFSKAKKDVKPCKFLKTI